jgi:hypothetical protein
MEGLSELLATADELYGLRPEAFTAARDERARTLRRDGSRARALAVKELRRPSAAAWLVNALVRHRRDEVEQFLQLGEALRSAQDSLDAEQLRELNRQRQTLLAAIGREARALARELDRPVSEQVADEVEETLRAALADPAAANAVRSGRLTASLRYAGFGESDMSELVALPSGLQGAAAAPATRLPATTAPRLPALAPGADQLDRPDQVDRLDQVDRVAASEAAARQAAAREAVIAARAAEEAVRRAQGQALVAEQHRDGLVRRARSARDRLDIMQSRVAELESMLAAARDSASAAAAGWAPLHAEADAATARAEAARGLAESARATLAAARAHLSDVERSQR